MLLGSKEINRYSSAYLIAEIGVNHEGNLDKAKELIKLAKEGGADAAKFQSYKAETLAYKEFTKLLGLIQKNLQLVNINLV